MGDEIEEHASGAALDGGGTALARLLELIAAEGEPTADPQRDREALRALVRATHGELRALVDARDSVRRSGAMLAQRDALLRDLLDNAPMMVFVIDASGRVLLANTTVARYYDKPLAEIEGKPFANLLAPEAAAKVLAWDDEVRRAGRGRLAHETLLRDGRFAHFQVAKFPVGAEHGYDDAVASLVVDISESWTAHRRASVVAELSRAFAIDVDVDEVFAALGALLLPEFADWCTLIVGEVVTTARTIGARHVDPTQSDRVARLVRAALVDDDPELGAARVYRTGATVLLSSADDGGSYALVPVVVRNVVIGAIGAGVSAASGRWFREDDVEFFFDLASRVGVTLENQRLLAERERAASDLARANGELEARVAARTTELLAQNELLRDARAAADRANETKSKFLAQMSHEIRTPMNAVLGMATLLLETPLTDEQRGSLQTLRSSADALLVILNELLDVAKIESGRVELEIKPVALQDVIREAVELFAPAAAEKRLELSLAVAPEVPAAVYGDPTRLRQIVVNLVGNAIKFTDRGRVTVEVRAPTTEELGEVLPALAPPPRASAAPPCLLRIAVRDTGIGMSKAHQGKLFQPFVQVHDSTNRIYGGTGLGLSIVRYMAELMGGRVDVASELGEGTELVVLLALHVAESPTAAADDSPFDPTLGARAPLRLLVAEDNVVNQRVALSMLARFGYTADLAVDGEEAVAAVSAKVYDVVLMDVQMPRLDGVEAARRIRASSAGAATPRIVAMTASSYPEDRARCADAGMEDFVTKPIRPSELARALRRAFAARSGDA